MWDRTGLCQKKGFLIKVSLWQYRKSPTYEPSGCELSKMPVYPEKGWRETRGRRSNWRAEEAHNAGDGKGMFFIWEDCSFLRNRTWMQKGPWSLQQPFRMQFSATMSSMMREKATIQMSLDQFFKRGKRIESSNEPEPVPLMSDMSETSACSATPIADDLSAPPSPTYSPSSFFVPVHSVAAPICQVFYCTTVLFRLSW